MDYTKAGVKINPEEIEETEEIDYTMAGVKKKKPKVPEGYRALGSEPGDLKLTPFENFAQKFGQGKPEPTPRGDSGKYEPGQNFDFINKTSEELLQSATKAGLTIADMLAAFGAKMVKPEDSEKLAKYDPRLKNQSFESVAMPEISRELGYAMSGAEQMRQEKGMEQGPLKSLVNAAGTMAVDIPLKYSSLLGLAEMPLEGAFQGSRKGTTAQDYANQIDAGDGGGLIADERTPEQKIKDIKAGFVEGGKQALLLKGTGSVGKLLPKGIARPAFEAAAMGGLAAEGGGNLDEILSQMVLGGYFGTKKMGADRIPIKQVFSEISNRLGRKTTAQENAKIEAAFNAKFEKSMQDNLERPAQEKVNEVPTGSKLEQPIAETVTKSRQDAPQSTQIKQPWEMTRNEFDRDALYQGTSDLTEGKTRWWTDDPELASKYAQNTGRGGKDFKINIGSKGDMDIEGYFNPDQYYDIIRKEGGGVEHTNLSPKEYWNYFRTLEDNGSVKTRFSIPPSKYNNPHKYLIEKALADGKPVPPEVLKDYPDLQSTITKPQGDGGESVKDITHGGDNLGKVGIEVLNRTRETTLQFDNNGKPISGSSSSEGDLQVAGKPLANNERRYKLNLQDGKVYDVGGKTPIEETDPQILKAFDTAGGRIQYKEQPPTEINQSNLPTAEELARMGGKKEVLAGKNAIPAEPPTTEPRPTPESIGLTKAEFDTLNDGDIHRKQVGVEVENKIKNFERNILGGEIPTEGEVASKLKPTLAKKIIGLPGTLQEKLIAEPLNKLADKINKGVEKLFGVDNDKLSTAKYAGKMAKFMHGMFRNFGETREAKANLEKKQGGMATGTEVGVDLLSSLDNLIKTKGSTRDTQNISREKIHAIVDPEMSKPEFVGIKETDLSPQEAQYLRHVRETNDLINDAAYSMGRITREKWESNRGGKYIARMYDFFEMPEDVDIPSKNYKSGTGSKIIKGLREDLFKKRGDVTDWKEEHILRDPAYLTAKRLSQILRLKSMDEYSGNVEKNMPHLVTSDPKIAANKHFVQMPNGYGKLSGKWVAERVAEDYRGFRFQNQVLDTFYDAFKLFDNMKVRRGMKKMLTVMNPGVRIGNRMMNYSFAFAGGVDPVTHFMNNKWAANEIKTKGQIYRYAVQRGVLGKNIDMEAIFNDLKNVENMRSGGSQSTAQKFMERITQSYQKVDDISKLSMIKTLVEQGMPVEKAVQHTMRTLQNYNSVGKAFDFGTKVPIVGQPFGKFSANLLSIIKHDITRRPLSTAAFVASIYGLGQLTSSLSDESPEEKKLRSQKAFAPGLDIPFIGRIPLTFKVGKDTEINIARYLMPYYNYTDYQETGDGIGGALKQLWDRFSPVTIKYGTDGAISGGTFQDPIFGPVAQTVIDKDFRGKSIADPNISPFKPTGYSLTGGEKLWNRTKFLVRAYLPDTAKQTWDMGNVVFTGKDSYDREKTKFQQALRFFGVRAEKMGPDQYNKISKNISDNLIYRFNGKSSEIKSITKLWATGKITLGQFSRRMEELYRESAKIGKEINGESEPGTPGTEAQTDIDFTKAGKN